MKNINSLEDFLEEIEEVRIKIAKMFDELDVSIPVGLVACAVMVKMIQSSEQKGIYEDDNLNELVNTFWEVDEHQEVCH